MKLLDHDNVFDIDSNQLHYDRRLYEEPTTVNPSHIFSTTSHSDNTLEGIIWFRPTDNKKCFLICFFNVWMTRISILILRASSIDTKEVRIEKLLCNAAAKLWSLLYNFMIILNCVFS